LKALRAVTAVVSESLLFRYTEHSFEI